MKNIFYLFLLLIFSSCEENGSQSEDVTYIVASQKNECEGVDIQKCFLIKENEQENWTFFYSDILGFSYQEGFEYKILVEKIAIKNPAADGSSLKYTLLDVLSKEEKESEI